MNDDRAEGGMNDDRADVTKSLHGLQALAGDDSGWFVLGFVAMGIGCVVAAITGGMWMLGFLWRIFKIGAGIE